MINKIINSLKGWWNKMFDYNKVLNDFNLDIETSKDMIDAIKSWSDIFNGNPKWKQGEIKTLRVAKTVCEKVAKAVTIELKTECTDKYINNIYQRFMKNIRKNTEFAIGKSCIFFKPVYENKGIKISVVQGDKFIPFKFDDTGEILGAIFIDQITKGKDIYTRLEYNELFENSLHIKNIAYKGQVNGVVLANKIELTSVAKWKELQEDSQIEGIDKLLGGFFTMNNANTVDNDSPLGVSIFHEAIDTLEEIDEQFSRTLWEYRGSELAIDIDETLLEQDKNGNYIYPKGKKRLFRKLDFDESKDKQYNIFSPEIRDTSLFNGLNELLRQAESEMGLSFGTISKLDNVALTATEIKSSKQDYYVTVSDIQKALQISLEDLIYGIYVLCKLYNIPVETNYEMSFDWDDSILINKDEVKQQAQLELNQGIIDEVEYFIKTKDYTEEEAIAYVDKIAKRKAKKIEKEPLEEEEE